MSLEGPRMKQIRRAKREMTRKNDITKEDQKEREYAYEGSTNA